MFAQPRLSVCLFGVLMIASTASATPILTTSGVWLPVPAACECGNAFYDNQSADGRHHGLAYVLERLGLADGLDYMSTGGWTLTEWAGVRFYGETAYNNPTLTELGGVLTYNDQVGAPFHSNAPSGGVAGFALFRRALSASVDRIWVAVNDTWAGDRDFQDSLYVMDIPRVPTGGGGGGGGTGGGGGGGGQPVAEPMSIALFGMAAIGLSRRMRRRG